MIMRPDSASSIGQKQLFPGEIEGDFESAQDRVLIAPRRGRLVDAFVRIAGHLMPSALDKWASNARTRRTVAFDGFRTDLYDEKLERDRRYGTVYMVSEEANAFLVRLEMPRRLPRSALKQTWNLSDEMPDYDYSLELTDNVLSIRAGVPGEAFRRLSYVSSSFPSDFLTRVDFQTSVEGFKHRLRDKVLEVIVFKRQDAKIGRAA